jgi:poly-gamma-glutamate synthesis protein (capsule biosynthesis protein)
MRRRRFLGQVGRAVAAAGAAQLIPDRVMARSDRVTMAAVGDCVITRKVSERRDARFLELVELMRGADCTWGNCEMIFHEASKVYPTPKGRDMNVICEPWGADELKWMGFDVVGNANNHTMDYGAEGLLGTLANLDRVGISHAGAGADLQEASRPGYVDTPGGRVAQVSCAPIGGSVPAWSVAGPRSPHANGRPGLSPLWVDMTYQVEPSSFNDLGRIEEAIRSVTYAPLYEPPPENELTFMGRKFVPGSPTAVLSAGRDSDIERITNAVTVARRNASIVIVTIHAHAAAAEQSVAAGFLRPFAHACIDAGADAFFGTGPHLLRAIEVYQDKPIFYSLGNFLFQFETVKQIPAEVFQAGQLDVETLDPSLYYDWIADFYSDSVFWESVVPYITFEGGVVQEIKLYPITLGREDPRHRRGTPMMATREEGHKIVDDLMRLSRPYGTQLEFREGIGYVRV